MPGIHKFAHDRILPLLLFAMLGIHGALLAVQGYRNAPSPDEMAHLVSGYSHWVFGDFRLYRVNPPLIRMLASFPLLFCSAEWDWGNFDDTLFSRSEFPIGAQFTKINRENAFFYLTLARWTLIPLSVIGGLVCYRWATELFGKSAGLLSVSLWCFCPNLLAWGASITPDAGATTVGLLCTWRYWKWLKQPSWRNATIAGLTLGVAELSKSTWIILFPMWFGFWFLWRQRPALFLLPSPPFRQFCLVVASAVYIINLGYIFEGSGQPLGDFTFISRTLGGPNAHENGGNRLRHSWVGRIPVPLPSNYVRGIDVQKYELECGKWSYLRGQQKIGGWWYYYLYGILVKTPLGFLALTGLAAILLAYRTGYRKGWRDELMIVLPGLTVLALVSSQMGFNRYLRYVLPTIPFFYLVASRVAVAFVRRDFMIAAIASAFTLLGISSSLSVFPHSMSYFNYAVGGPVGGKFHLLDANLDWGQDVLRFKEWINDHPEARPLRTAVFTGIPIETAGIEVDPISDSWHRNEAGCWQFRPGWYAVSVNELMGYRHYGVQCPECMKFQQLEPVEMIGYSIYIYHVSECASRPDNDAM